MTATLWIVRHGNTFEAGERPRRIGARTDLPLTVEGRAQAARLAARFAADGVRFDSVLSGPLARARETATIIAGAAPETAAMLDEIDHGPDENADEAAVEARIGRAARVAWDADGTLPSGWIADKAGRRAAWQALFATAAGQVLLVTSNGAARFALLAAGLRPPALKLRTGAYGRIEIEPAGRRLIAWDMRP